MTRPSIICHMMASVDWLIDEVSILVGPGIDGREGQKAVFDGRPG